MSNYRGRLIALVLSLLVVIAALPSPVRAEEDPEEKAVLAQLFVLNRSLEASQANIDRLAGEMEDQRAQEAQLLAERDQLEARRQERLAAFGRRLRFYSEAGASAPVAYLLASSSMMEFMERLDLLSQILEQDARLLADLRQLKTEIQQKEAAAGAKETELAALKADQEKQRDQLQSDIADKEAILAGLRDKRAAVEAQLAALDKMWEESAQPALDSLGSALKSIKLDGFQPDSVKATFLPPGVTIRISESSLTDLLRSKADLSGLTVRILPDSVNLEGNFNDTAFKVTGKFTIQGKSILRYEPNEIDVGEYKVPEKVTQEILSSGKLDIDLSPIMGTWRLKDVGLEDQFITIKAGF